MRAAGAVVEHRDALEDLTLDVDRFSVGDRQNFAVGTAGKEERGSRHVIERFLDGAFLRLCRGRRRFGGEYGQSGHGRQDKGVGNGLHVELPVNRPRPIRARRPVMPKPAAISLSGALSFIAIMFADARIAEPRVATSANAINRNRQQSR